MSQALAACAPAIDFKSLPAAPARPERFVGIWEGSLGAADLRLVVRVRQTDAAFTATVDSPDQGAYGVPVDDVRFDGERFASRIEEPAASDAGKLTAAGRLGGEWREAIGGRVLENC